MSSLRKRRSLKAKLALWSMLAVVIVVSVFTSLTLRIVHTDTRQSAGDVQAALADSIAQDLDGKLGERRNALTLAAAILGPLEITDHAALSEHFDSRPVLQTMFDVVFTADRQGRIDFDSPSFPGRVGRSVADRAYFQEVLASGKTVISQPLAGKTTSEPNIVFAAPLRDRRGQIRGVLCGIVYLTRPNFLSALGGMHVGKTGYVALMAKGDKPLIVMHPQRERILEPVPPPSVNPHANQALQGFEGTVEGTNSKGLEALFTYRSLRNVPWVLVTAYPTAEAYAQIRGTERQVLVLAAFLLLFGGLGVWALAERLLSPLERLRQAMLDARHHAEPVALELDDEAHELHEVVQAYNELMAHKNGVVCELTAAERRLRLITDNLPAQITQIDLDERYVFVNAAASAAMHLPADALVGRGVRSARGEALYADMAPHIRAALHGERVRFESDIDRFGQPEHYESHYVPDLGEDGRVRGIFTMTFDITRRKQAELRQARSEARVSGILTHAADAFIGIGPDGAITEWNRQAEITFGWSRAEVLGRRVSELLIPPELRAAHDVGMARFMYSGAGPVLDKRIEVVALRRDGGRIPVELSVQAVPEGDQFAANAFLRDISERKAAQARLAASENRLRDVTDNIPALIGYFDADERCEFANEAALRHLGFEADTIKGRTMRAALGEALYLQHKGHVQKVLGGSASSFEGSSRHDGVETNFQTHLVPDHGTDGSVRGFYVMSFDITPIKRAERQRAEGEQRLRLIADNLPVLISYIDSRERLQFVNETYREWMGVDPGRAVDQPLRELLGPEAYAQRREQLRRALGGERVHFDMVSSHLGVSRHLQTVYVPDLRADGEVAGVYALSSDVTALKLIEQQLGELARVDSLTALPNRRAFDERLRDALLRSRRAQRPMALMFLDIDHFKQINDTHGHGVGDLVLKEFARRLSSCVRLTDMVARLAGDEFVIILEGLNTPEEAATVARKIGGALRVPLMVEERLLLVTSSIGISYVFGQEVTPAELVAKADSALYDAKRAGRNTFAIANW